MILIIAPTISLLVNGSPLMRCLPKKARKYIIRKMYETTTRTPIKALFVFTNRYCRAARTASHSSQLNHTGVDLRKNSSTRWVKVSLRSILRFLSTNTLHGYMGQQSISKNHILPAEKVFVFVLSPSQCANQNSMLSFRLWRTLAHPILQ
jgi:hypothetical protein